jgi:hypothetical protein
MTGWYGLDRLWQKVEEEEEEAGELQMTASSLMHKLTLLCMPTAVTQQSGTEDFQMRVSVFYYSFSSE